MHNFSVSVALLPSPQPVNSLRKGVKLASGWGSVPDPAGGAYVQQVEIAYPITTVMYLGLVCDIHVYRLFN